MLDDIDYRNLLAANSEEDLVLFQADLVTTNSKLREHGQGTKKATGKVLSWPARLKLSLFKNRTEQPQRNRDFALVSSRESSHVNNADFKQFIHSTGSEERFNQTNNDSGYFTQAECNQRDSAGRTSSGGVDDSSTLVSALVAEQPVISSNDEALSLSESPCLLTHTNDMWKYDDLEDDVRLDVGDNEAEPLIFGSTRKSPDISYRDGKSLWHGRILAGLGITVILAAFIGGGIAIGIIYSRPSQSEPSRDFVYQRAAVAADAAGCSEIGRDVLTDGGGAIDAAIAGLLCVGLYNAHSTGIGGGSFTLYYDKQEGTAHFWDSREKAPLAAHKDMYVNKSEDASTVGGLAIGVPGEINGYWEAHQMFGRLPWRRLFEPSIQLAENGLIISTALGNAINSQSERILADESLREIFTDSNGRLLTAGDTMYRRKLANTLRQIAVNGASEFYNGSIAESIAAEVQNRDGIITVEDLAAYSVEKRTPLSFRVNDMTVYSGRPPCSGAVYALILNILEGYDFTAASIRSDSDKVLTYHRIIEAFKFAYAKRSALGDESFVDVTELVANMTSQTYADGLRARINDDRTYNYTYYDPEFEIVNDGGTAHISIVDQEGNAASVTSTINTYFGSKVRGNVTGIIFNNEMDDFSKPGEPNNYGVPPSETNFIVPGKRPMSSMTPVIMVDDNGDVRFVAGASGGTRITTATSLVSVEMLWFESSLVDAVERRRVHHQLVPQYFNYEPAFPSDVVEGLEEKRHVARESSSFAVVQAIKRLEDDWLEAHCDSRKGGRPAGF